MSLRFSYQRPEIFVPGTFGEYGRRRRRLRRHRLPEHLQHRAHVDTDPQLDLDHGVAGRVHEVPQRGGSPRARASTSSTDVGIPGANYDDFSSGISRISIGNGFTDPLVGFSNSLPWDRGETTVSVVGMVTKLAGNHTIKIGTEVRHNEDFLLQIQDAGGVRGQFSFNGARTSIPSDTAATAGIANAFAAFLLDAPSGIQRDVKVIDRPGTKHWAVFAFAHDKWQVTPKLTLDLGVRWEYYTPFTGIEEPGRALQLRPLEQHRADRRVRGHPAEHRCEEQLDELRAPARGVVPLQREDRGAGRLRHDDRPLPGQPLRLQLPGQADEVVHGAQQLCARREDGERLRAARRVRDPDERHRGREHSPAAQRTALLRAARSEGRPSSTPGTWPSSGCCRGTSSARSPTWATLGKGIVLPDYNINAGLVPGLDRAGQPYNQKYGRTANVHSWLATDTHYHSLQAKLDRKFRNGFLITTSYTLSRAINYSGETDIDTPADIERSKGRADFDRTHVFASSFLWDMPFFKNDNDALHWILGGWQIGGIFAAYSGTPVNFSASNATLRAPDNKQWPTRIAGDPEVFGDIGPGQLYFDTKAFAAPPDNAFSNMKRFDSINGPGYWTVDLSLVKRFKFGDRVAAELRADAFNAFNHPAFGNPNGGYGSATFGQVTGMAGSYIPRLVRFGARLTF